MDDIAVDIPPTEVPPLISSWTNTVDGPRVTFTTHNKMKNSLRFRTMIFTFIAISCVIWSTPFIYIPYTRCEYANMTNINKNQRTIVDMSDKALWCQTFASWNDSSLRVTEKSLDIVAYGRYNSYDTPSEQRYISIPDMWSDANIRYIVIENNTTKKYRLCLTFLPDVSWIFVLLFAFIGTIFSASAISLKIKSKDWTLSGVQYRELTIVCDYGYN